MPTLLDAMKQIQAKPKAPQSQQEDLQQVARKAQTGKARAGAGAKASGLGEQRAISQVETAGAQQAQQGAGILQGMQQKLGQQKQQQAFQGKALKEQGAQAEADMALTGQIERGKIQQGEQLATDKMAARSEMELREVNNKADNALSKLASDRGLQQDRLFTQFERSNAELEDRKDAAELEQLAFTYSLQDQKYLDELNRIGQERRLTSQLEWERECQNVMWGSELVQLFDTMKTEEEIALTGKTMALSIREADIDTSIKIARAATKDAALSKIIEGGGDIAKSDTWKDYNWESDASFRTRINDPEMMAAGEVPKR